MEIEVAYIIPTKQTVLQFNTSEKCTIRDAIILSGILSIHADLGSVDSLHVGVFGRLRSLDWALSNGDRVEIYRQLAMDPKDARKVRAKQQAKRKKDRK